jgi:predicted lipoprotein with Yx(FWY)xxD motif
LIAVGKSATGAGAKASLVGTTKRADGRIQLTYRGHPLYTFANDSKPGQTSGEGVNAFGGSWYVVSPAGSTVVKQKTTAGGGYGS